MKNKLIKRIEELSINAWPALQTMIYDGWILRIADGYTRRANSINPLFDSAYHLDQKIELCEKIYLERNLNVVYKMTPSVCPNHLNEVLANKGYLAHGYTSVQLLELNQLEKPSILSIKRYETMNEVWLSDYCRLNNVNEINRSIMKRMLSSIVPKTCFISLLKEDIVIACGLGVVEGTYMGLFDLVTDVHFRNQGYGEQLILSLLEWGKEHGAKHAYLQVVLSNTPALGLYSKLGFQEVYQYWYRIKSK